MPRARKKPVEIEYIQWTGKNLSEIFEFSGAELAQFDMPSEQLIIPTLEGNMRANVGNYIIKGIKGELYPCRADVFEATYELIED